MGRYGDHVSSPVIIKVFLLQIQARRPAALPFRVQAKSQAALFAPSPSSCIFRCARHESFQAPLQVQTMHLFVG